ncbi:MAG TPA: hypothetical protein VK996_16850 [Ramlibacter sp.]|nr:hypothetical protein [Ramlibacter sp.]
MNIDLLPFTAFALESCGTAGQVAAASPTLTLQLDLGPVHPMLEPMDGTVGEFEPQPLFQTLHAAVVPACSDPLTITFQA